jgi:hypothetical protein
MNRWRTAAATIALTVNLIATPTRAAEPLQFRTVVDLTLAEPELSSLCGFAVYRHLEGKVNATLFLDEGGVPVREIDTSPSLRYTFFSPDTGKSVSYPGTGTLMTDYYADGTAVATVAGHLTFVQPGGTRPLLINVGLFVFRTVVIDTTPDGLPVIGAPMDVLFETGVDHGSVLGACQALAP